MSLSVIVGGRSISEAGSPRVEPSSLTLQADPGGPSLASFTLSARPGEHIAALDPFTPVTVEVDGLRAWSGHVRASTGSGRTVNVECSGTQAHLEGDLLTMVPADVRLGSWSDPPYVDFRPTLQGSYNVADTNISFSWEESSYIGGQEFNCVTYAGAPNHLVTVVVSVGFSSSIGGRFVILGHDGSFYGTNIPAGTRLVDIADTGNAAVGGTTATKYRYLSMGVIPPSGVYIPASYVVTVYACYVFDRDAYRYGLNGTEVAKRVRELVPQLSPDGSQITGTQTALPHFEALQGRTARDILGEAAGYDDAQVKVDQFDRLVFGPRTGRAVVELGHRCPPSQEAPSDPSDLMSAVVVSGQTPGGADVTRRYTTLDLPETIRRPSSVGPANPDFQYDVLGWTTDTGSALTRVATDGPSGIQTWASWRAPAAPPYDSLPINAFATTQINGTLRAGVSYQAEVWMFDAEPPSPPFVPVLLLRMFDINDQAGMAVAECRITLYATYTPPYPWQRFTVTFTPRGTSSQCYLQLYNVRVPIVYPDGSRAHPNPYTNIGRVRIYEAPSLLSARQVTRTGQVSVPIIPYDEIALAAGQSFLREHARQGYTATRVCADGAALDARTHAPLPAASLLAMTGQQARVADRLDPVTGQVGARATISAVTYSHAERRATVELGQVYGSSAALIARLSEGLAG